MEPGTVAAPGTAVQPGDALTVNPMTIEAKHFAVGAVVGFVVGVMFGYFREHGIWGIVGFGLLGMLLGGAAGGALPSRKLVKTKNSLGYDEYHYEG